MAMTLISKNVCIHISDDKANNTTIYQKTIKMKPVDLNSSICNDFHVAEVVN